jgi:F0F1-type ATP synthase membrane subunit b/b'
LALGENLSPVAYPDFLYPLPSISANPRRMEAGAGSSRRAKQLIGCALSHADELRLEERQIVALNRLYWSAGNMRSDPDLVSEVGSLLSPEQFRTAVGRFAELSDATTVSSTTDGDTVDSLIASALESRFKDRSIVEVEVATAIAERLIGWSKAFGIFVAAPMAVLLVILGLFGFAKFDDVRKAADRADELLGQAQTKLSQSSSQLDSAEKKVEELIDRANRRAAAVERQLASLQESTAANSQQIAKTQSVIQRIESQLGGFAAQAETGNKPAGDISESSMGKAYGPWAMMEGVASELVSQPDFPWREDFRGLAGGSPGFDAAWRRVGSQEPERFKEAQRSYIQTHYFDPAVKLLKSECDLDVTARSRTFQELVWLLVMDVGRPSLVQACRTLHDKGNWNLADRNFEEVLIRAIYKQLSSNSLDFPGLAAVLSQLREEQQHRIK